MDLKKLQLFISHAREDNELSHKIAENLKRNGFEVWIDETKISGGDSLPDIIGKGIESSDIMILVWSKSAKKSRYVRIEWECAFGLEKRIIPCVIDNEKLPPILSSVVIIDFSIFNEGYKRLAQYLKSKSQPEEQIEKKLEPQTELKNTKSKTHTDDFLKKNFSESAKNISSKKPIKSQSKVVDDKISITNFRSYPVKLSASDVKEIIKKYDFYDLT